MERMVVVQGAIKKDGKYLLMRRSLKRKHSPGLWEFPSGKLIEGEETIEEGAAREVKEETGMDVELRTRYLAKSSDKGLDMVVVCYECDSKDTDVKMSDEHTEFMWVTLEDAKRMNLARGTRTVIGKIGDENGA